MAYVYRHIRLDKNEVFYIGIGSDVDGNYLRSTSMLNRNVHWHNIVNLTKYDVEILFDDLTWQEACIKEKEFIALYGRRDLGLGTLVNLTDGGEGSFGLIMSNDVIEKLRKFNSTIIKCPYCLKDGNIPNMKRYHFQFCKSLTSK